MGGALEVVAGVLETAVEGVLEHAKDTNNVAVIKRTIAPQRMVCFTRYPPLIVICKAISPAFGGPDPVTGILSVLESPIRAPLVGDALVTLPYYRAQLIE